MNKQLRVGSVALLLVLSVVAISVVFSGAAIAGTATNDNDGSTGVTAGTTDQSANSTLQFAEDSASDFPNSGSAIFEIPDSSSIQFDQGNQTTLAASASGEPGTTVGSVEIVDSKTLRVNNIGTSSSGSTETITVSGVKFTVPVDASDTTITSTFGDYSANDNVEVERLETAITANTQAVRGADETGSFTIAIEADDTPATGGTDDTDAHGSDGFVASGSNITVSIPSNQSANIDFDKSSTPSFDSSSSDVTSDSNINTPVFVDDNTFTFQVDETIDSSEEIEFNSIQFNVSGVSDQQAAAEIRSALNVSYTPVTATGTVEQQAQAANIAPETPNVYLSDGETGDNDITLAPGSTKAGPGATGTANTSGTVSVVDNSTNNLITTNGDVVITLPQNSGITFDQSQTIEAEVDEAGGGTVNLENGSNVALSDRSITVPISSPSNQDELLLVGSSDGTKDNSVVDSLKFNTTTSTTATNVNLTVTTNGGAADVVQNTTLGQDNDAVADIDISGPTVVTNDGDKDASSGGNNLVIETDGDGETKVAGQSAGVPFVIQSGAADDIAKSGTGTNITVTLPDDSALTFDQSNAPSVASDGDANGDLAGSSRAQAVLVDARTLNITTDADDAAIGNDVAVTGLQYNVSADTSESIKLDAVINRTGVSITSDNFINTTATTADDVQADADISGSFGSTGDGDASASGITFGSNQESRFFVQNSTDVGDVPLTNYGGATLSLEVTDTPDDGSVSDVSLNTTNPTTNENGEAGVNVTFSDSASASGTYNVTASLASNSSVNVTAEYSLAAGDATQFNVTGVDNAVIDDSGLSDPVETEVAAYSVRIEDNGGNIVSDTSIDFNIDTAGNVENVFDAIDADGTPSTGDNQLLDDDSDGARNYQTSDNGGTEGQFFVFVTTSSAGDLDVTISQEGVSDTGTATIFDNVDSVNVQPETSTVDLQSTFNVTATAQTSDGTQIEVPRLTLNELKSDNTTVLERNSLNDNGGETFANGSVSAIFNSKTTEGTANITANIAGATGDATITVEEDAPAYYTLKLSNSIADRDVHAAIISIFSTHRQSGSTALLPHSVYRYTRTHTGGQR